MAHLARTYRISPDLIQAVDREAERLSSHFGVRITSSDVIRNVLEQYFNFLSSYPKKRVIIRNVPPTKSDISTKK